MKLAAPYTNNRPYVGNIAIIGFSQDVPLKNKLIASFIAMIFTMKGYNIVAGNVLGTFSYAFGAAKMLGGRTMAIVDNDIHSPSLFIDQVLQIPTVMKKHENIALLSSAAIIIGGGDKSLHLAKEFIKQGKPIIAITGTHGIVDSEVKPLGIKVSRFIDAISYIIMKLTLLKRLYRK